MIYYYDFKAERSVDSWREIEQRNGRRLIEGKFVSEEADLILLWPEFRKGAAWEPDILTVNGVNAKQQDDFYIREKGIRRGMSFHARSGVNTIVAEIIPREYKLENFSMQLLPAWEKTDIASGRRVWNPPPPEEFPEHARPLSKNFTLGMGHESMPGRFGFVKGDGLLDCAMWKYAQINKMFLCGHPRYQKPFAWGYSLLQNPLDAELPDELKVDQFTVQWKRGKTCFTYSIMAPAICCETEEKSLRISKLEFASNYQYVMSAEEIAAVDDFSGRLPENWLLFFGASEFPDVPLLVVLTEKPARISFSRLPCGRLSSISFDACRKLFTMTPFGFDALNPQSPEDEDFLADALWRCRLWSRACLALPTGCQEYFQNQQAKKQVRIVQRFSYQISRDTWGTKPLKLALLPPVLTLSGQSIPAHSINLRFPSKFGDLRGFCGDSCAYTVAMMQPLRKYPLRDEKSVIPELLADGLDEYFEFEAAFPDTIQSYAYPGAILESYAYCCSMLNFMPVKYRDILWRELSRRLHMACDPERKYTLLLTDHGKLAKWKPNRKEVQEYYNSDNIGKIPMFNAYEREEPFTKRSYSICYFNVSMMLSRQIISGSRKEVAEYPEPFVENDWGVGITFYMLYTAALASGDFSAIKKFWPEIKKTFYYFIVYHDWACMGAGYAEKARTWIEGANFGAFTSFQKMAEVVGDQEACEFSIYLSAKMLALCQARFLAGPYFAKHYDVETWYGNRAFQEEYSPCHNFQYVPKNLDQKRVLPTGVSMLTTDAIYPELFTSFRKSIPEIHRQMMERYRVALQNGLDAKNNVEFSYLLVNDALDEQVPAQSVIKNMALAEQTGRFLTDWHDIHRFENALPKNYLKAQLLAWLEMRKHELWLEHWEGIRILDAIWRNDSEAVIVVQATEKQAKLLCGLRKSPTNYSFTGKKLVLLQQSDDSILFTLEGDGTIVLAFA